MITTPEAPTIDQCGAAVLVQDGSARTVACDLERDHHGWHEGALKDEQGKVDELVTWR